MRQINPENEFLAMHPRFTHDFTALAYIARDEKFLSHTTNYQMKMMSWPQEETPVSETIVDRYPDYPSKDTEFCGFYGYNDTYSLSQFLSESKRFFLTESEVRGHHRIFVVDVKEK